MKESLVKQSSPTICIIGSGQIGSLFATHLNQSNKYQITVLGTNPSISSHKENGLTASFKDNTTKSIPPNSNIKFTNDPTSINRQDFIIVALKSFDQEKALPIIKNLLKPNSQTSVIIAQNGIPKWLELKLASSPETLKTLDPDSHLKTIFENAKIFACVLNLACSFKTTLSESQKHLVPDYTQLLVATPPEKISIYLHPLNDQNTPKENMSPNPLEQIEKTLKESGIKIEVTNNFIKELLDKLIINICINGPSVLASAYGDVANPITVKDLIQYDPLNTDQKYNKLVFALANEARQAIETLFGIDQKELRTDEGIVTRLKNSKDHHTSMQMDFFKLNQIEVSSIYEALPHYYQEKSGNKLEFIPTLIDLLKEATQNRNKIQDPQLGINSTYERFQDLLNNLKPSTTPSSPNKASTKIASTQEL